MPESTEIAAPDWSTIDRDILCPLCDYNLRGLVEPRCPECGHLSRWDDLLAAKGKLRWLYEHQRARCVSAIVTTFAMSQSNKFWKLVRPDHEINLRRLAVYAIALLMVGIVGGWLPLFASAMIADLSRIPAARARLEAQLLDASGQPLPGADRALAKWGGARAYIDYLAPEPLSLRGMIGPLWRANSDWRPMRRVVTAAASWPVLTVMLLLAFRKSLKKVDVSVGHFWRVAIYSVDLVLPCLAVLPFLGVLTRSLMRVADRRFEPLRHIVGHGPEAGATLLLLILLVVAGARFAVGYKRYLGWPTPLETTAIIQIFVLLAIARCLMYANSGF